MRRLICNCLVKCSLMICKSSTDIYTIHTPSFRNVHAFIVTYIMYLTRPFICQLHHVAFAHGVHVVYILKMTRDYLSAQAYYVSTPLTTPLTHFNNLAKDEICK